MRKLFISAIGFLSAQLLVVLFIILIVLIVSTILIRYLLKRRYIKQMELLEEVYEDLRNKLFNHEFSLFKKKLKEDSIFAKDSEAINLLSRHKKLDNRLNSGYELINDYHNQESVDIKETSSLISYLYGYYDELDEDIDNYSKSLFSFLKVFSPKEFGINKGLEEDELKEDVHDVNLAYAGFGNSSNSISKNPETINDEKEKIDMSENNKYFEEFDDEELEEEEETIQTSKTLGGNTSEYSVFGKGLVINGDVSLETPLVVFGEVRGNILSNSQIQLEEGSNIVGDVQSLSTHMEHSNVEGNVISSSDVYVGKDSRITGNVQGDNLNVSGYITGDVNAAGEVKFMQSAHVVGNIRASFIDIERGAKVKGSFVIGDDIES